MRAVRPFVLTLATAVLAGPLATVAAHAASAPAVSITAPANGSSVTGKVTVTVSSRVDPADVAGAQTTLLVNGTALATKPCDAAVGLDNCPTTFTWDSTGLNGSYPLTASVTVPSAPGSPTVATVQITAVNPPPQVSITSPAAGAVVKGGTLTVQATGSVDLSQSDQPVSLQLVVDGANYGVAQNCELVRRTATAQTCDWSFTVTQPRWFGSHTVQVTFATKLASASSAVVPYDFFSDTRTSLQPIGTVRGGSRVGVRGSVVGLNSLAGVAGARVVVTITPAVGKKRTVVLHTGSTGNFSLAAAITANSTVTASVSGAADFGGSQAHTTVKALAPIVCKADRTIRHGSTGRGTCTVAQLPDRTKVTLQYQSKKKHWLSLGSGTTKGTTLVISYKFDAKGKYPVRLVLGANKAYVLTYGTPFTVTVS